jgi:hypothetical protein
MIPLNGAGNAMEGLTSKKIGFFILLSSCYGPSSTSWLVI